MSAKPKADWQPISAPSTQTVCLTKRSIQKFILSIVRSKTHSAALVMTEEKAQSHVILFKQHSLEGHGALAGPECPRKQSSPRIDTQFQCGAALVGDPVVRSPHHRVRDRRSQATAVQDHFRAAKR